MFRNGAAQNLADYDYENLTFRGIGFDLGYIWPNKVVSTNSYNLHLDLGFLGPGVRVVSNLGYWSSTFKRGEINRLAEQLNRLPALADRGVTIQPSELGKIDWSDISLGVDLHYVWTVPLQIITYLGAGAGLHLLNGQGTSVQDTFVEDLLDSTAPGLAVMGGLELEPTDRFRVYGELRYTLMSDVRYPGVRVGAALMFPPRAQPGAQGTR
jgi:opacity protein-like surface antigen